MIKDTNLYRGLYKGKSGANIVQRVTRRTAKGMYAKGYDFFLQSVNMPFDGWLQSAYLIDGIKYNSQGRGFDAIVNEYEYYNTDSERGKYAKFYVFMDDLNEYKRLKI